MRGSRSSVWLCIVWLLGISPAWAQETATVVGRAIDAQGAVLPAVGITARNVDTGFVRSGVTDAQGEYRIAAIPPGRYELTAELAGFATLVRKGVTLTVGSESAIDFTLQVSGLTESVTITADIPVVETTTATVAKTINREQIDLLPLIGRDYNNLLRLLPGAQSSNGDSFTGSRGRSNQFLIDGVDNSADISGYERTTIALDSLQEFQVLINSFKAEYGRASGAIINAVTRSGSNTFHGSGLFLFRNQELMAQSPYADRSVPETPFRRIHYGGTFGGPLVRDKLLFFGAYDREDRETSASQTYTLPLATSSFSVATRQFLSANGIPLSIFGEGGRQRLVRPESFDVHKLTLRADQQVNANHLLTYRLLLEHSDNPDGSGGTLYDYNGNTTSSRQRFGNANHKWIVGPALLNELFVQVGQSTVDSRTNFPTLTNLIVTGGFNLGGNSDFPQARTDWVTQVLDHVTWTRGNHLVKSGVDFKVFRSGGFFDANFRGTYTFPTLQRFIDGSPSILTVLQGDSNLDRPNALVGLYLQDDWRLTPNFTLNAGLRWDYETGKVEAERAITGEPGAGTSVDRNNFGPRLGFVWAPRGTREQAIYGGAGVYYDQVILNVQGNARFTPPKIIALRIDNPSFPNPFAGGSTTIPPSDIQVVPELTTPYSVNASIGYRRELARDLGVDVSVVHNRGYGHILRVNENAGRLGSASVTGTGAVRPDPTVGSKLVYRNLGEIEYTGLLVDVRKRFSNNFDGNLAYTLAQTRDNGFNFLSQLVMPERPDLNWGRGSDDRRHRISAYGTIRLPWDVDVAALFEFRTEAPLNITAASRDVNGDGITGDWVNETACIVINCAGFRYSRNSEREVSTEDANRLRALFGLAPIAQFEDNPKFWNVNLSVRKDVRIGTMRYGVTAEAFNLFNIPQRNLPQESITSGTFGARTAVIASGQPRAVQFTLEVRF